MGIEALRGMFVEGDILNIEPNKPKFGKDLTQKFALKCSSNIRISNGLFYTDEEWEKKRAELLKKPLP